MCLATTPTYASNISDQGLISVLESNASKGIATAEEVEQLEKSIEEEQVSVLNHENAYEPNDTVGTAFPYSQLDTITCGGAKEPFGHYNCFYNYTFLETENDLDFFKVNLQTGFRYVVVLKNVWTDQTRDIRLYYMEDDGKWYYWHPTSKVGRQSLFHFTPDKTTYYIRISGSPAPGCSHTSSANWFAVERDGTIDERLLPYDENPSHALQSK